MQLADELARCAAEDSARADTLEKLAKELAKALGTGARVEGTSIVVQGDQPDRLATALEERGFANVTRGN